MSKEGQPAVYQDCSSTFSVDLSVSVLKLSGHVDLLESKFIYIFIVPYYFMYHFYFIFFNICILDCCLYI